MTEVELRIHNERGAHEALKLAIGLLESKDFTRPLGKDRIRTIDRHFHDAWLVFSRLI